MISIVSANFERLPISLYLETESILFCVEAKNRSEYNVGFIENCTHKTVLI